MSNPDCVARNCTNEATEIIEDDVCFCAQHALDFYWYKNHENYPVEVAISVLCD